MVIAQAVPHRLQRDHARRREHACLPHAATEHC